MIDPRDATFSGHGLNRPECAVTHVSGWSFCPNWTAPGGVSAIAPDGRVFRHLAKDWDTVAARHALDPVLRANGVVLEEGGSFLLAHLGDERGGVFRLHPDGQVEALLVALDGAPLPPCNFAGPDGQGGFHLTVSTRRVPRADAYRGDVADGFIIHCDDEGHARIVADGLGYTNEAWPRPDGKRFFANETFARRIACFDLSADGSLANRRTFAELGPGNFCDGLAFDENGDVWVSCIVSNRLLRVDADGQVHVWMEDCDPATLDAAEAAWRENRMGRPHLDNSGGAVMRNVSNLAFLADGSKRALLGCLLDERMPLVPMPVAGAPMAHWTCDITPLISALEQSTPVGPAP